MLTQAHESGARAVQWNNRFAEVNFALGLVDVSNANYEKAIQNFEGSLRMAPRPDAYRELANAYDLTDRLEDAEAAYLRAIELEPDYWAGYKDLGLFYQKHGRLDEAVPPLKKVLQLTPDNYYGYVNLGAVYLKLKLRPAAIEMLKQSISLRPNSQSYYNLGTAYYLEGRYREASEMFRESVKINPLDYRTWSGLGDAYRWMKEVGLAADAYRHAIALAEGEKLLRPQDARLRSNIASRLILTDKKKALVEISEALRLNSRDSFVQARAALVYEQNGMRRKALAAVESAIKLGFSIEEIENWPPLEKLRGDPYYRTVIRNGLTKAKAVPISTK
jgi:superkiller protein 3